MVANTHHHHASPACDYLSLLELPLLSWLKKWTRDTGATSASELGGGLSIAGYIGPAACCGMPLEIVESVNF
jgi:hypothetical protein